MTKTMKETHDNNFLKNSELRDTHKLINGKYNILELSLK